MKYTKENVCSMVSDEALVSIARKLGLSRQAERELASLRSAICGDKKAAAVVEELARRSPGCGCKGKAVKSLAAQVAAVVSENTDSASGLAIISRVTPGGGSGLVAGKMDTSGVGKITLYWNHRRSQGNVSACKLTRLARQRWPSISDLLVSIDTLDVTYEELGLPEPGLGNTWYVYQGSHKDFRQDLISQQLAIHDFIVVRQTLNEPDESVVPNHFGLATEVMVEDTPNGPAQAFDFPADVPRKGYLIEESRCRCTDVVTCCFRVNGRWVVAFALPTILNALQNYKFELTMEREALGVACGPDPEDRCGRYLLPEDPCSPSIPEDPTVGAGEDQEDADGFAYFEGGEWVDSNGNKVNAADYDLEAAVPA